MVRTEPEIASRQVLLRCVAEPAAVAGSAEVYPTLADKAAALMIAISTRRPLKDGNKRTAFAAMNLFLHVNGYRLMMAPEVASLVISEAAQKILNQEALAWFLSDCLKEI